MILLVLRLFGVYLGSAALLLFLSHRFVRPVRPGAAVFMAGAALLLTGKAFVTGGVYAPLDILYQAAPLAPHASEAGVPATLNPALGDVVYQEIPWRKAAREALRNARLPLWNRFVLAGEPLLAVQQPAILHPATWAGLLLPLAQAWTYEVTLRFFLALLAAYLFLRELDCGELPALLGACGWAFCDYLVFFAGYPLSAGAAPFPFLLLALRRVARRADRASAGLLVAALLAILTAGHPETLLHAVAGAGVFFLFELARAPRGGRTRAVGVSLAAGAATLGLSAVLLLPLIEALPQTAEHSFRRAEYAHSVRSAELPESANRLVASALPFAFGVPGKGDLFPGFLEPSAYAGSLLLPLAFVGLFSARREKWSVLVPGALGLLLSIRAPLLADLVARLPLFDIAVNERAVFLAAFAVCALAGLGAERLLRGPDRVAFAVASIGCVLGVLLLWVRSRPLLERLQTPPWLVSERLLLELAPLAAAAGLALAFRHRRFEGALAALIAVFLAARFLEARRVSPTLPDRAFAPTLASLAEIPRGQPWRFAAVGFRLTPNSGALYELEDVRGYEAMTFRPLLETFPLWCVAQPVWFNRVDDPTRPFLAFLNVRWALLGGEAPSPAGWTVRYRGPEGLLVENPRALPRAFVPTFVISEPDPGRDLVHLSAVTDFAAGGVVSEGTPGGAAVPDWHRNGRARVSVASYAPQSLSLDIVAAERALVGTSVTAWRGWRLTLDGVDAPLLRYNHAFLAFRTPPGRHRALLAYRPRSFSIGLVASAASLAAVVLSAAAARRRRASATLRS